MKVLLAACLLGLVRSSLGAGGAGRAYPVLTENYVVNLFRGMNPSIDWDKSNFLVDLSGNYANCDYMNTRGFVRVDKTMPNRQGIQAIVDYTDGSETHTVAVDEYIRPVMDRWTRTTYPEDFAGTIRRSDLFACSVRPGCPNGRVSRVVMACLFADRGLPIRSTERPRTTTRARPTPSRPTPPIRTTTRRPDTTTQYIPPFTGEQKAKAFTPEQYSVAEGITKQRWDRSHLLENLSGYETDCTLVGKRTHDFDTAESIAKQRGFDIVGLFGVEENRGSTPNALEAILEDMKESSRGTSSLRDYFFPRQGVSSNVEGVGCSVIPDCIVQRQMYVVVACVFQV